jgi:hypothetical protein
MYIFPIPSPTVLRDLLALYFLANGIGIGDHPLYMIVKLFRHSNLIIPRTDQA